jgi:CRP/FNR family transcriptional regulator
MDGITGHTHALASQGTGFTPGESAWEPAPRPNASLCMRCPVRERCIGSVAAHAGTRQLVAVLAGRRELQSGETVHDDGDAFETLSVVRSGALQSLAPGGAGQRVRGFHFPGELVGVGGLALGRHVDTVVALEATELCAVRFHGAGHATTAGRAYDGRLWDMMSRDLLRRRFEANRLAGLAPEQRLLTWFAATLPRLSAHGSPSGEVLLPVSADDVGNYLGLGAEGTAEALAALAARGLLALEGDGIRILHPERLQPPVGTQAGSATLG